MRSISSNASFKNCVSLLIFCFDDLSIGMSGVLEFPTIIVLLSISPFISVSVCLPHSSTLAWKIPWMEKPGGLQSMGSLRVGRDWATSLSVFTFMYWRRKWQPTPLFLPGESQGCGAWWAAIYGVAQGQTWLKQISSSSSSSSSSSVCLMYWGAPILGV